MHRAAAVRVIAAAGALSVLLAALLPAGASAGQFTVASCQADRVNFSTTAFNDFATRGMTIRRACNPEGPGIRGLVTANSTRRGTVPRGSVAMVAIAAPSGTRFTTLPLGGVRAPTRLPLRAAALRRGTRHQAGPDQERPRQPALPAPDTRAGRRLPLAHVQRRPARRAIVQRVICVGGDGRKSCSARGTNYIRTYQAEVGVVDEQAPTATIAADTPLATGAWVSGSQPLQLRRPGQRRRPARAGRRGRSRRRLRAATVRARHAGGRLRERRALPERRRADHGEDVRALRRDPAARRPGPGHRGQRRRVGARRRCASTTPRLRA